MPVTKLKPGKPVIRETEARDSHKPIIVELHSHHLMMRIKGKHGGAIIDYERLLSVVRRIGWGRDARGIKS